MQNGKMIKTRKNVDFNVDIFTPFKKSQQTLTIRGFEDYTNI